MPSDQAPSCSGRSPVSAPDRFARLVHWLDLVLETRRGSDVPSLPFESTITPTPRTVCRNPAIKVVVFSWCRCGLFGLAGNTIVADIDIVTAGGEIYTGLTPKAILMLPVVLLKSALIPMAVLLLPVVLLKSA